jgi:hypothetical protein
MQEVLTPFTFAIRGTVLRGVLLKLTYIIPEEGKAKALVVASRVPVGIAPAVRETLWTRALEYPLKQGNGSTISRSSSNVGHNNVISQGHS